MVRKATKEDIDIINSFKMKLILSRLKYNNPSLDIINDYTDYIEDDNNIFLVFVDNNKEIGYLYGYKCNNKAILNDIFVLDEYRDCGIGQELFIEFKNWAINNSLKNIEVNIENGNDVYFLFEKFNFEITNVTMNLNI